MFYILSFFSIFTWFFFREIVRKEQNQQFLPSKKWWRLFTTMTFICFFHEKKVTYLSRKIGRVSIFKEESGNTKALTKKCRLDLKYFFKKIKIKPYYLLLFLTSLYKYVFEKKLHKDSIFCHFFPFRASTLFTLLCLKQSLSKIEWEKAGRTFWIIH